MARSGPHAPIAIAARAARTAALGMGPTPRPTDVAARVAGRLAVVTGGSRGIGAATARRLAVCGARVVVLARPSADLDGMRDVLARHGGDAIAADLRDADAARAAAREILAVYGAPDVIVSNAGHSIHRSLAEYTDRFHDIERTAAINYLGPIAFLLPLTATMVERGGGHLVNVSSTAVDLPLPGWSAYSASKAAFDAWLSSVAPELARSGVRASSVHLPRVRTAMSEPTRGAYPIPELSADEAAAIVCRAIVERPRLIAPWWSRLAAAIHGAAPGGVDAITSAAFRSRELLSAAHRTGRRYG